MKNSNDDHIIELIPAYALNSLDPEDRMIAANHFRECEYCKAELRTFNEVVGELAYTIKSVEPPNKLKGQILGQLPSRNSKDRKRSSESWWQRFVNFSNNTAPVWAIASLFLVIFLGATNLFFLSRLNDINGDAASTNLAVINLNGTDVKPDAEGLIVISKDGMHGTLIVDRLPSLDESRQYQLWLIKEGKRVSGGVFSVGEDGYGSLWVDSPDELSSYGAYGITIEPSGGSPGPTGEKVLGSDV